MEKNRAIGATTRTVDHAIQMLFKHKFIQIPKKTYFDSKGIRNPENYIVDPSSYDNYKTSTKIQNMLKKRILRRLNMEHPGLNLGITETIIAIER